MALPDLRFGVAEASLEEGGRAHLADFAAALSTALGRAVEPLVLREYDDLDKAFRGRKIDLGWLPPLPALRGLERGTLLPIAVPRRHGIASFWAVLFARRGTRFRDERTLRGARAAWVERSSTAGFLVVRERLVALGIDPRETFASEAFFHGHAEVVRAVLDDRADVGATWLNSKRPVVAGWTGVCKNDALQTVMTVGPVPHDVVATTVWLPPTEVERIQGALLDDEQPAGAALLRLLGADRMIAPQQRHLEPLAKLLSGRT